MHNVMHQVQGLEKADMQEAGAREEHVRGLSQEAMAEYKNKNKSKKQGAFNVLLQEAAMPATAPPAPFSPQGKLSLSSSPTQRTIWNVSIRSWLYGACGCVGGVRLFLVLKQNHEFLAPSPSVSPSYIQMKFIALNPSLF